MHNTTRNDVDGGGGGEDAEENFAYEQVLIPIVFLIIFVVGVLGNGTLVIIFLRHRTMRNVPNTYILSLALADLLVIIVTVPFISLIYTLDSWPWGTAVCKISETVKNISIGVSVFTLTALSAERYCAIVNPLRRLQTKPMTVLTATLIWLLACLLALPDAIFSHLAYVTIKRNNKTIAICTPFPDFPDDAHQKTYTQYSAAIKAIIYYILPLLIISGFYILMAKRLHASTKEMPGEMQGQSITQTKARRNVARMVLAFVFLFFICFFPYHLFMLWFFFDPDAQEDYNEFWHALKFIGFCLSFLNSCVNPVALYCVSGVFRQHFNRYLCCRNARTLQRCSNPSQANCETSFNSYRRQTQSSAIESHSIYQRRHTLSKRQQHFLQKQSTNDMTVHVLDGKNNKREMIKMTDLFLPNSTATLIGGCNDGGS